MDQGLQNWLVASTAVTALAVVTQVAVLVSMFMGFKRLQSKIENLIDREIQPLMVQVRELVAEGRKTVDKTNATVDDIAAFAKTNAGRMDLLLAEAADRARLQLIRADQLISDALSRLEQATETVHRSVAQPMHEIQAVLTGVRAAVDFFFGRARNPRGPVDRTPQDEELFI
jgi:uncharacterized protein YoxC